jgi:hypothetical protein
VDLFFWGLLERYKGSEKCILRADGSDGPFIEGGSTLGTSSGASVSGASSTRFVDGDVSDNDNAAKKKDDDENVCLILDSEDEDVMNSGANTDSAKRGNAAVGGYSRNQQPPKRLRMDIRHGYMIDDDDVIILD